MVKLRSAARWPATWPLALALVVTATAGCASSPPAPTPPPAAGEFDGVRRIVVVASGESRFTARQESRGLGREFDQVMRWVPYKDILVPVAHLLYWGITLFLDADRASSIVPPDVTPAAVVADAFALALSGSGPFDQIVAMNREPVGDARRSADAIVRLAVPSWGLVAVREGSPQLVAAFADVRAQVVLRETGVLVWEHEEDVTHPERLSLQALTADRALTREQLIGVLDRAGRRLANELIYTRGRGQ